VLDVRVRPHPAEQLIIRFPEPSGHFPAHVHLDQRELLEVLLVDLVEVGMMPAFANADAVNDRLTELGQAVSLLLKLDYAVIIDMHPGSRFKALHGDDPDRALQQLEAAWRLVATRFASTAPDRIFFELLNEPSVRQSVWTEQAGELAAFIRRLAPNHTLIYGPAGSQNVRALEAMTPLDVSNVVYAVHF
jgi:endoglucanase